MQADAIRIALADPRSAAARACLAAYAELLFQRVPGITAAHVPDPDPQAADYHPPRGAFLLAWSGARPVACVALKPFGPAEGEVKRLWVDPAARGLGLGRRMMAEIEQIALCSGMTVLRLDTNETLTEAIQLYRTTGWTDGAPYSGFPATHWFEKTMSPEASPPAPRHRPA